MNAFFASLAQIWKGLTAGQRFTMVGGTLFALAVLFASVWWSQQPQMSLLYAGLDPSEASKITDELRDQKIRYEISNGGRSIYVPNQMVYDLRMKLASKGIPRSGTGSGGVGFEIFDKPSFGLSDFLQKANYYRALQGELERTISQMEEVEKARVLVVVPTDRLFVADKGEAKASVFLQLKSNLKLKHQQVSAIRFLVANGVEGLKPSHVAVVSNNGDVLAEDEQENGMALSSSQLEMRKSMEALYVSKVQTMLDRVLGDQQSVVRITLDMDFDTTQKTEEKFDPTAQVLRSENILNEDSSNPVRLSSTTSAGGIAGNTPPAPGTTNNSPVEAQIVMGTTKKQSNNNQYEISKVVQSTLKGAGEIKKVSVAVFVNQRVQGAGANRKAVPRTPQEMEILKNVIRHSVGFVQDGKGKRNDEIAIEEVPFAADPMDPATHPVAAPTFAERIAPYLSWGKQALLAILAIGALLYFRRLLAGIQSEKLKTEFTLSNLLETESAIQTRGEGGISVAELSKLIRENPSNISQSLKNWIKKT